MDNSRKSFKDAEFSWEVDYNLAMNYGGLNADYIPREDNLKLDVFEGFLDGIDEIDDIYAANDLSTAWRGFLLDQLPELDSCPPETSRTSSDSHSSGLSRSNSSVIGVQCEVRASCEANHLVTTEYEYRPPAMDNSMDTILSDFQNLDKLDHSDVENPLATLIPCRERQKNTAWKGEAKTNDCKGSISQAPYDFRPRRGRPEKHKLELEPESDGEFSAPDIEDKRPRTQKIKGSADRRKHQRMWTLAEVMKLVDGISQFGAGKWTDIKRLHFPKAEHRTPVDLRDKWRNLLKASSSRQGSRKCSGDKAEKPKCGMRRMPNHLVRRIRELAAINPYPNRKGGVKISRCDRGRDFQLGLLTRGDPVVPGESVY